jgi:hypothetical protein
MVVDEGKGPKLSYGVEKASMIHPSLVPLSPYHKAWAYLSLSHILTICRYTGCAGNITGIDMQVAIWALVQVRKTASPE